MQCGSLLDCKGSDDESRDGNEQKAHISKLQHAEHIWFQKMYLQCSKARQ